MRPETTDVTARGPRHDTTWVELDLGDAEASVVEFADGLFAIRIDDTQLVCTAAQMEAFGAGCVTLMKAKSWI
jgi:hypothetical protein